MSGIESQSGIVPYRPREVAADPFGFIRRPIPSPDLRRGRVSPAPLPRVVTAGPPPPVLPRGYGRGSPAPPAGTSIDLFV